MKNKGVRSRQYVSVFGSSEVFRQCTHIEGFGNYYPLDERLNFPKKQLSYTLMSLIGQSLTEEDYRESVRIINELLSLNLGGSQAQRIANDLAPSVDEYYEQCRESDFKKTATEGTFLAFGNDGKGVPIVKSERGDQAPVEKGRLMKGQKRGIKKQATVAVSFSFTPRVRDSEDVLRGLFREPPPEGVVVKDEKDRRFSKNVHKRAFMCNQSKAIDYALTDLAHRNPQKNKPIIALVDCGTGLEQGILRSIKAHDLEDNLDAIIADIVHVSEYIWKAANAILGEKFKGREAWVRSMMKDILQSNTQKVITDLRANIEKTTLSDAKNKQVETTIKYLSNHAHKMDYKTYLEKGYPISTGLIEGCCGHLIKDRMEPSGTRWTIQGAQNMIDLRAVKKNEDWNEFMAYVKQKNNTNKIRMAA